MDGLELSVVAYDDPVVAALVEDLQRDLAVRYGAPDETPVEPAQFAPPQGLFLVGRRDGAAVVCGGWRRSGGTAEVKRLWVDPGHRRQGLSRAVLQALEDAARTAGVLRLRLETGDAQPEAIALYEATGWHRIPGFGHYGAEAVCFGKEL